MGIRGRGLGRSLEHSSTGYKKRVQVKSVLFRELRNTGVTIHMENTGDIGRARCEAKLQYRSVERRGWFDD